MTRLAFGDLTYERVVGFLKHLEMDRGNHIRTRNQRLAALHCLFEYIAWRAPEMLLVCQRVAGVRMKRAAPAETRFLERDEVEDLLRHLPRDGRLALRDRTLLLFLYNTGARVQEAADLRLEHLDLGDHPLVRLHGKGDKWRTCPLWRQTAALLTSLLESVNPPPMPNSAVLSAHGQPLTRFGVYKIVRRHGARFDNPRTARRVSPHIFRHSAAVHLLETGVEEPELAAAAADRHRVDRHLVMEWQVRNGPTTVNAVRWALELGYRHIDTAQAYGDEGSVGRALRESGVPRERVFITTKFFPARAEARLSAASRGSAWTMSICTWFTGRKLVPPRHGAGA